MDAFPAGDRPALSAISLWEVACLVERGRLACSMPLDEWLAAAADPHTVAKARLAGPSSAFSLASTV